MPDPSDTAIVPSGLPCGSVGGCTEPAEVQWLRRNPDDPDSTDAVRACRTHAISLDLAARVHQAGCTAPDPATLPSCACTPEPIPAGPPPSPPDITLPTGWTIPAT